MSNAQPTPETDKLQSHTPVGTVWLEHSKSLERERDQLQRWKDDQMFIEAQWDAQAVGRELDMVAGTDIRRNILPCVVRLKKELHEAHEALSGRTVSCSQCNEEAKRADSKHRLWMGELYKVTELEAQIEVMRELLREIRDDEVNSQDEADKFLRDHAPSELSKMREAIKAAHEALRAWPKAGHGMSTDHTLQSQAFRTGQAALAKLKPFLP
jgi:hypothetical protein